ncbi:hypothetical protein U1Q18_029469 [Sarracenia purpurea var. burkii]
MDIEARCVEARCGWDGFWANLSEGGGIGGKLCVCSSALVRGHKANLSEGGGIGGKLGGNVEVSDGSQREDLCRRVMVMMMVAIVLLCDPWLMALMDIDEVRIFGVGFREWRVDDSESGDTPPNHYVSPLTQYDSNLFSPHWHPGPDPHPTRWLEQETQSKGSTSKPRREALRRGQPSSETWQRWATATLERIAIRVPLKGFSPDPL